MSTYQKNWKEVPQYPLSVTGEAEQVDYALLTNHLRIFLLFAPFKC